MPTRIFVADDHDVVREGVKSLLKSRPEWTICGEAADGKAAIEGIQSTKPDAIVLDISMPLVGGLDVATQVIQQNPEMKILIFTMHDSKSLVQAAMRVGARGVVLKSYAARDLIQALERILGGGSFFESGGSQRLKKSAPGVGMSSLLLFSKRVPG
jgi:DNA-binding NarL/FixJ family response regulator